MQDLRKSVGRLSALLAALICFCAGELAHAGKPPVLRPWRPRDSARSELWIGFSPSGSNYGSIGSMNLVNPSRQAQTFSLKEGMSLQPDPRDPNQPKPKPPKVRQGIRMRLVDESAQPMRGVAVVLLPISGGFENRLVGVTDANGHATFLNPPPGRYRSMRIWVVVGRGEALEYGAREVEVVRGSLSDLGTRKPNRVRMRRKE